VFHRLDFVQSTFHLPLAVQKSTRYSFTCTPSCSLQMSTHFEQYSSYQISISRGSKAPAPDDHTLVGSGDLIVRWPDGRGRRYRNTGEISDCLALPYRPGIDSAVRPGIDNAIRTGQTMATMVPFELSFLPTEGESQSEVHPYSCEPY
jgi:hypothetical protein